LGENLHQKGEVSPKLLYGMNEQQLIMHGILQLLKVNDPHVLHEAGQHPVPTVYDEPAK
jgi:hypothetical protein